VLLDVQLIGGSGVDVLRQVRTQVPDTGFIVLTNFNTPQYRRTCIQAGASHFVDKMQVTAIKEILAGPKYSLKQ
jgi:DNA-binding NarL/FixJ family response regulator